MASINEISQAASYRGDPNLGGGLGVGVTIDVSPLQRLANFTYYRDRDMWEQKQRQDKQAADQIANIAAFDTNSPLRQYRDDLLSKKDKIEKFMRENPKALVHGRDPNGNMELKKLIGEFEIARTKATANDALYNGAKTKNELIVDPTERAVRMRRLDFNVKKLFSGGLESAYNQQLEASPEIKQADYQIPTAKLTTREFILTLPNKDIITQVTYIDPDDARANSALLAAGGLDEDITTKDWFKELSDEEKQIALDESKLTYAKRRNMQNIAASVNSLYDQWKADNKGIDINTVDINTLPNNSLGGQIRSARVINDQIDELNELVLQGKIVDPSGRLKTTPYQKIKLDDGLSEDELIFMKTIQESKTPLISKVDKTIQETDDASQAAKQAEDKRSSLASEGIQRTNATTSRMNATKGTGGGGVLEGQNIIDLTGHTGSLSIADMAAIDPNFVTSENGVLKLTKEGKKAQGKIKILPNGDAWYMSENSEGDLEKKIVDKGTYQRNAITATQTILKDRKGEEGNPFTNTGKKPAVIKKEISRSDLPSKAAAAGYPVKEYEKLLKEKGVTIKE